MALAVEPNNTTVMDLLGEVLSDLGDVTQAESVRFYFLNMFFFDICVLPKVLRSSVSLQPDEGYSKYMYLGQLTAFPESVAFFEKGVVLLTHAKGTAQAVSIFHLGIFLFWNQFIF